jgi:hypothetical protein
VNHRGAFVAFHYVAFMRLSTELEQHIAVFGESGSGKTVMLSSFYGATQEPQYLKSSLFHVVADDIGQGSRLHRNYLGMRDSARRPEATRFSSTSYAFLVKLKDQGVRASNAKQFDALRLVWHDYPGEWFEQDVSGPEEAQRRVDTFRSLLGSDVALLLVDGQRLLDNAGEEERYLKSLLGNFRNGLLSLKDQLLDDGKPLVRFPRIWILALSKVDLLPEVDVFKFRDLMIDKASDDLDELRKVLAGLVESSDAMAVGEDFLLLSSAKFEANKIEVTERVGLDLVLPLAAMLPFQRHIRWVQSKQLGAKVVEELLSGAGAVAAVLIGKAKFTGPKGLLVGLVGRDVVSTVMNAAAKLAGDTLRERNSEALAKHDYVAAALTGFGVDLDDGENERVLLRSRR